MNNNQKKGIINPHFLKSLLLFLGVLIVVLTFVSFLEEAQLKDRQLNANKNYKK